MVLPSACGEVQLGQEGRPVAPLVAGAGDADLAAEPAVGEDDGQRVPAGGQRTDVVRLHLEPCVVLRVPGRQLVVADPGAVERARRSRVRSRSAWRAGPGSVTRSWPPQAVRRAEAAASHRRGRRDPGGRPVRRHRRSSMGSVLTTRSSPRPGPARARRERKLQLPARPVRPVLDDRLDQVLHPRAAVVGEGAERKTSKLSSLHGRSAISTDSQGPLPTQTRGSPPKKFGSGSASVPSVP